MALTPQTLESLSNQPRNRYSRTKHSHTLPWRGTAAPLKGPLERTQIDANDAKWKIARGHKNPAQDVRFVMQSVS